MFDPVPGAPYGDGFGPRNPIPGVTPQDFHTGLDRPARSGTPIYAAHDGTVRAVWWDTFIGGGGAGGWMIAITGDDGYETRYAHKLSQSALKPDDRVVGGKTVIGAVGMTGAATGPHLHFEVVKNGKFHDPKPFITKSSTTSDTGGIATMADNTGIFYMDGKNYIVAVVNTDSGYFGPYSITDSSYNQTIARGFRTGSFAKVTKSHYEEIRRNCEAVRKGL